MPFFDKKLKFSNKIRDTKGNIVTDIYKCDHCNGEIDIKHDIYYRYVYEPNNSIIQKCEGNVKLDENPSNVGWFTATYDNTLNITILKTYWLTDKTIKVANDFNKKKSSIMCVTCVGRIFPHIGKEIEENRVATTTSTPKYTPPKVYVNTTSSNYDTSYSSPKKYYCCICASSSSYENRHSYAFCKFGYQYICEPCYYNHCGIPDCKKPTFGSCSSCSKIYCETHWYIHKDETYNRGLQACFGPYTKKYYD